jgi:GNAT superfamily N-acetyltransferase
MSYTIKILDHEEINLVIPLVKELSENKISESVLRNRFSEMVTQNYECAVIYHKNEIVGITGLWYCTRHYSGRSVELDHVIIDKRHRNKGLGKKFMTWIGNYVKDKGYEALELNTYVQNYPSHKFYYNLGFQILGYHFLKKL